MKARELVGWVILGAAGAVALAAIWLGLSAWKSAATVATLVVVAALIQGPPAGQGNGRG